MIISWNQINEYIDLKRISLKKFTEDLFNIGIEVEHIQNNTQIKEFIVGKIIEINKHPQSNKLTICIVQIASNKNLQIVCGASNVFVGAFVPVALVGAIMPTKYTICKRNIMGIESNGMICSLSELGYPEKFISEKNMKGIYIFNENPVIGESALKILKLSDVLIDLTFTSNRFHLNSIINLVSELAAYYNLPFRKPHYFDLKLLNIANNVIVENQSKNTKSYAYFTFQDVVIKPSHQDIQQFLFKHNIRPINSIVDLTNMVMLELNQPLHAYDLDITSKNLIIKEWNGHNKYELLSNEFKNLNNYTVIANKDVPLSVAGIIGNVNSSITNETKNILIEAATWDPIYIRKSSKDINTFTNASTIYSRSLPQQQIKNALSRIAYLAKKYGYTTKISEVKYLLFNPKKDCSYKINQMKIERIVGPGHTLANFKWLISRIFFVKKAGNEAIEVIVPGNRIDVCSVNDIIEIYLRLYGINNIKEISTPIILKPVTKDPYENYINKINNYFISIGFYNCKSYNLISLENIDINFQNIPAKIEVENVISAEHMFYKKSNLSSLLHIFNNNVSRNNVNNLSFYEVFNTYGIQINGEFKNFKVLSFLFANSVISKINAKSNNRNFFWLTNIILNILEIFNLNEKNIIIQKLLSDYLNPYNSYTILYKTNVIGVIGQLKNNLVSKSKSFKLYYGELYLEKLLSISETKKKEFKPIHHLNLISKDVSFIFEKNTSINWLLIIQTIYNSNNSIYKVELFDYFKNQSTQEVSLGIRFYIQPENANIETKNIIEIMHDVIGNVINKFSCRIIETNEFKNSKK